MIIQRMKDVSDYRDNCRGKLEVTNYFRIYIVGSIGNILDNFVFFPEQLEGLKYKDFFREAMEYYTKYYYGTFANNTSFELAQNEEQAIKKASEQLKKIQDFLQGEKSKQKKYKGTVTIYKQYEKNLKKVIKHAESFQ